MEQPSITILLGHFPYLDSGEEEEITSFQPHQAD
jgi:hypothetical protein